MPRNIPNTNTSSLLIPDSRFIRLLMSSVTIFFSVGGAEHATDLRERRIYKMYGMVARSICHVLYMHIRTFFFI